MFNAEDWLRRLQKAGCNVRIDEAGSMMPTEGAAHLSPQCEAIWQEIQGAENKDNWDQVVALARSMVPGHIGGWIDLPKLS
jgi:hypothetical protein